MDPEEIWKHYAGGRTPAEFMRQFHSSDPYECAEEFVKHLPDLYGIVRRGTWSETFAAEHQLSRAAVAAGLAAHLEATREAWEPALAERDRTKPPAPSPAPERQEPGNEESAAESNTSG